MGISINVGNMRNMRQDYSYLFQSMSSSSGGLGNLNFLSDYASIKNGSYGKLMKAYYGQGKVSKEVSSIAEQRNKKNATAKDSAETLSSIESAAEGLKDSADTLIKTGTKSVFNKVDVEKTDENGITSTEREYDTNAIYKSVSNFVNDYNKVINQTASSETTRVQNKARSLMGITDANQRLLSKVGISINKDDTLSIDEDTFKKADMATVKTLFNGNGSYAYRVSAQASMIDYTASTEASKANTYTAKGSYNNAYNTGSIYDYWY